MNQPERSRIDCFDALRVLATFAVVALHLSAQHWADIDVSSRAWFAFNLYDSAVRWAVPVFVMISGALFLSGTQSLQQILRKNVLRIATAFFFWSAVYALYARVFYACTWEETLFRFLKGHYHMWFLFMIVGLYLLVPILRRITADRALTQYFLLLALVFTFLLPQLSSFFALLPGKFGGVFSAILGKFFFFFTLGFTAYFIGGYFLMREELPRRTEWILMLLGILGFIFTLVLSWRASVDGGAATERFYGYNTIGVLLTSTGVFLFGKRYLSFPKLDKKGRAALRAFSRWSFGAYLIHPLVIETLNLRFGLNTLSCNAFFSVPLLTLLVGALSFLLSALLHQIPVVKKYIV